MFSCVNLTEENIVIYRFSLLQPLRNSLHEDLIARFLIVFLSGHANSLLVMTKLWQIAPDLLLTSFIEFYNKDATSISRTLDIAQELKV
jgi:CCR4-NOT transcription complex subunit 1